MDLEWNTENWICKHGFRQVAIQIKSGKLYGFRPMAIRIQTVQNSDSGRIGNSGLEAAENSEFQAVGIEIQAMGNSDSGSRIFGGSQANIQIQVIANTDSDSRKIRTQPGADVRIQTADYPDSYRRISGSNQPDGYPDPDQTTIQRVLRREI